MVDSRPEINPIDTSDLNIDWFNPLISTTTTTTLFYFILITFIFFQYKKQNDRFRTKLSECNLKVIPSPPKMPLIGNIYMMRDYQENPWEGFNEIRKKYGDIVSLKMGIHDMILLSNTEYIREVLLKKGDVFADRPYFPRHDIIFGGSKENSLALCKWSNVHRQRRKFCKRGVVPTKISDRNRLLEAIISEHSGSLISSLKSSATPILNKSDILFLTGDIFMKFLCSEKYSHEDLAYQKFNWNCDYIFYDINKSILIDFMPYLTNLGVSRSYLRELKEITDECRNFVEGNIFEPRYRMHKQKYELKKAQGDEAEVDDSHDYLDSIILEQLSESTIMSPDDYKVGFSDLVAGHAAVTNILMKVLGHLSLDEEAQDMIYEEARKVNLDQLNHRPALPISEAALLEALRLASSPIVPHVAREDTSVGEHFVPKGSAILFNSFHLHISEDYWTEPRRFNLKRFLDEHLDEKTGEKSYKLNCPKFFNPFSIGLRQCLGFRMVEAITITATSMICLKFKLKVDNDDLLKHSLEPRGTVAISPLEECYKLHMTPRS